MRAPLVSHIFKRVSVQNTCADMRAPARDRTRLYKIFFTCLAVAAAHAAPALFGNMPPYWDYPFHLARVSILAQINDGDFYASHYAPESMFIPNVAFDALMVPLGKLFGIYTGASIFLLINFFLLMSGVVFLRAVMFGRYSWLPLLSACILVNWITVFGFVNYMFGIGVMIWALAMWIRQDDSPRSQVALGTVLALVIFFCHLVAFGLYLLAINAYNLNRAFKQGFSTPLFSSVAITTRLLAKSIAPAFIPLFIYSCSSTRQTLSGDFEWNFFQKAPTFVVTLSSGIPIVDAIAGSLIAVLLVAFFKARTPVLISREGLCIVIAFLFAFAILPFRELTGPAFIDTRVIVAVLFISLAIFHVSVTTRTVRITSGLAAAFMVFKLAFLWQESTDYREVLDDYQRAYALIPNKSMLFSVRRELPHSWSQRIYVDRVKSPGHIANLASIDREIFVPALFVTPGGQPLSIAQQFREIKNFQGDSPKDVSDTPALERLYCDLATLVAATGYSETTYLLLQLRGLSRLKLPSSFSMVFEGDDFQLIRLDFNGWDSYCLSNTLFAMPAARS